MTLAFYDAKVGDNTAAEANIKKAQILGATDIDSQFMEVQALAVLGKKEDALNLLLSCIDHGLSPVAVELALDLKDLQKEPRYISRIAAMHNPDRHTAS